MERIRTVSIILFFGVSVLSGCVSYSGQDERGRWVTSKFGSVIYQHQGNSETDTQWNSSSNIGLRIQKGVTIGHKSNQRLSIPLTCNSLIVLSESSDIEYLSQQIKELTESSDCATQSDVYTTAPLTTMSTRLLGSNKIYTAPVYPPALELVNSTVSNLGAGFGAIWHLGHLRVSQLPQSPLCKHWILTHNKVQFDQLTQQLNDNKGNGLCITVDTR